MYINIHEVFCIAHLWLTVGVTGVGYEFRPRVHIFKLTVIYEGENMCIRACSQFYKSVYFLAHATFGFCVHVHFLVWILHTLFYK